MKVFSCLRHCTLSTEVVLHVLIRRDTLANQRRDGNKMYVYVT